MSVQERREYVLLQIFDCLRRLGCPVNQPLNFFHRSKHLRAWASSLILDSVSSPVLNSNPEKSELAALAALRVFDGTAENIAMKERENIVRFLRYNTSHWKQNDFFDCSLVLEFIDMIEKGRHNV